MDSKIDAGSEHRFPLLAKPEIAERRCNRELAAEVSPDRPPNEYWPTYIARDGVARMVDYLRSEVDPERYTPSATCVLFRPTPEDAQTSADDVAFMMDGYCRTLLLLGRVIEMGLANGLHLTSPGDHRPSGR